MVEKTQQKTIECYVGDCHNLPFIRLCDPSPSDNAPAFNVVSCIVHFSHAIAEIEAIILLRCAQELKKRINAEYEIAARVRTHQANIEN